jgi:hypothetical protein
MTTNNGVTTNELNNLLSSTFDPVLPSAGSPVSGERNFSSLLYTQAYERLNESSTALSNPPFLNGTAGRLAGSIGDVRHGEDPRILRGYIRRSGSNSADPTDKYRLYFMFNPETIERNYVTYLEQSALDPFNTVYGAGNLVAPPGILDFSFQLMFDRQAENASGLMPRGVLEDFDYFDMVVRGVVPDAQSPQLQDNGVMMINPKNITVVFGPQLSVQGRPYSAEVEYTKFDHKMTPVRMVINISMKAVYFGPVKSDFSFTSRPSDSDNVAATINYENSITYSTSTVIVENKRIDDESEPASTQDSLITSGDPTSANLTPYPTNIPGTPLVNENLRINALRAAKLLIGTPYGQRGRPSAPPAAPREVDCSQLVGWAYLYINYGQMIQGGASGSSTGSLTGSANKDSPNGMLVGYYPDGIPEDFFRNQCRPGDIIVRHNTGNDHAFFIDDGMYSDGQLNVFESVNFDSRSGPGPRRYPLTGAPYAMCTYKHILRPGIYSQQLY